MIEVRQSPIFRGWLAALADRRAVERIAQRIVRLQSGLMGDVKSVGDGVYFTRRGSLIVVLLCGGDKGSQSRDISRAKAMALDLED